MTDPIPNGEIQTPTEKFCPYLPPVPQMRENLLAKRPEIVGFSFMPCLKEKCAIFENCQGSYSPRSFADRFEAVRVAIQTVFQEIKEKLGKLSTFGPLLGGLFRGSQP